MCRTAPGAVSCVALVWESQLSLGSGSAGTSWRGALFGDGVGELVGVLQGVEDGLQALVESGPGCDDVQRRHGAGVVGELSCRGADLAGGQQQVGCVMASVMSRFIRWSFCDENGVVLAWKVRTRDRTAGHCGSCERRRFGPSWFRTSSHCPACVLHPRQGPASTRSVELRRHLSQPTVPLIQRDRPDLRFWSFGLLPVRVRDNRGAEFWGRSLNVTIVHEGSTILRPPRVRPSQDGRVRIHDVCAGQRARPSESSTTFVQADLNTVSLYLRRASGSGRSLRYVGIEILCLMTPYPKSELANRLDSLTGDRRSGARRRERWPSAARPNLVWPDDLQFEGVGMWSLTGLGETWSTE